MIEGKIIHNLTRQRKPLLKPWSYVCVDFSYACMHVACMYHVCKVLPIYVYIFHIRYPFIMSINMTSFLMADRIPYFI